VLQQLLAPGVLHQLLAEDQACDSIVPRQRQQLLLLPTLVQLVLQLGAAEICTAVPLQDNVEAGSSSSQLPQTEKMLAVLAAAVGYGSTDVLLGHSRSQLIEQVSPLL
jgi:hypothetical protein